MSDTNTTQVQVRWLIRRDMPEVLDIEQRSFPQAWTEEYFLTCLRQRNCIGMVAEHGQTIVGYMIYELRKHALHVLNFAVSPDHRREDIGTAMVGRLKAKLPQQRRTEIWTDVRDSNLAAQLFWKSQGFECQEVKRGFYDDGEDAYRMVYQLGAKPRGRWHNRVAKFM